MFLAHRWSLYDVKCARIVLWLITQQFLARAGDHPQITFREVLRNTWPCGFTVVSLIWCVFLDSEGQWMASGTPTTVCARLLPPAPLGQHSWCTNVVSSRGSAPESPPAGGGDQRGGALPAADAAECAPSLLLAVRNLNLTVEPAQYACNPTRCGQAAIVASGVKVKLLLREIERRVSAFGGCKSAFRARRQNPDGRKLQPLPHYRGPSPLHRSNLALKRDDAATRALTRWP